jgi:hypothetical protein
MGQISEEEKLRRRLAGDSVIGTSTMEGITLDAPTLALIGCFQGGEIDLDQMSVAIDLHVQALLDARKPEPSAAEPASVNAA